MKMSRFKIKKKTKVDITDKDVLPYEPADKEDLEKYDRLLRRWAHQHLYKNGLKLQSPNDKRVMEFLRKLENDANKTRKNMKTKLIQRKRKLQFALLVRILCYPFIFIWNLFKRLSDGKTIH
jgi:hypothetical protein